MPGSAVLKWIADWSLERGWHELDGEIERDDLYLMAMAQNHRYWMQRALKALEGADTAELEELVAAPCELSGRFSASASRRYDDFTEFQAIRRRHEQIHRLVTSLVREPGPISSERHKQQRDQLAYASEALLAEIGRLITRMQARRCENPSAPDADLD
jgi:hypothetical protein